ncbi:hypothetical protein [Alloscardovia criceti]|uniref:hypothetical protein n=1 Tax=Alloscardovia criceti TaxID=356828 RepID=UPI0012EA69AE|nr:hypothetical protein [Alloscardovia criceti]
MKKSWARLATATVAMMVSVSLCGSAMAFAGDIQSDTMVSSNLGSSQAIAQTDIPENPEQDLPDTVAESVPEDSTLVSESLAVDTDGTVYDVSSGNEVTDPNLVGTVDAPADPLAKTDGESFIPVDISDVKDKIEENTGDAGGLHREFGLCCFNSKFHRT